MWGVIVMRKWKEKVINALVNAGRRYRSLTAPVLAVLTLFLVLYHSAKEFYIQLQKPQFRRRLSCFLMAVTMFFAQTELLNVIAAVND